jgi:hypothetical protein
MRYVNFGLILFIFFAGHGWVRAEEKSYPANKEVELVGTVKEGIGYDANNKREEYYFLSLEKTISVGADEFNDGKKGVKNIQLVPLSGAVIGKFLGKQIAIKGKLFHSFSAHHHTKILFEIGKSNDARLVSKP